jgi:cytochrome c553
VSFATFCEILNSAIETMHGRLKVAAFGTGLLCKRLDGVSYSRDEQGPAIGAAFSLQPREPCALSFSTFMWDTRYGMKTICLLIVMALGCAAVADDGKTTYATVCATCHGGSGEGNPARKTPSIASHMLGHISEWHLMDGTRKTLATGAAVRQRPPGGTVRMHL